MKLKDSETADEDSIIGSLNHYENDTWYLEEAKSKGSITPGSQARKGGNSLSCGS